MKKQKNKSKDREYKFRVWNSKKNSFITNYKKTPHIFGLYNGLFNTFDSSEGFIYSQYVGLMDKKANEIYEGDIISFDDEINVAVECEKGAFGGKFNDDEFCEKHQIATGFQPFYREFTFPLVFGKTQLAKWEIIGNIYENHYIKY